MSQHHHRPDIKRDLAQARPRIAATLPAPCNRCGQPVLSTDGWDAGHIISIAKQLANYGQIVDRRTGPEHRHCNRGAGGKQGAAKTNRRKTRNVEAPKPIDLRMPTW